MLRCGHESSYQTAAAGAGLRKVLHQEEHHPSDQTGDFKPFRLETRQRSPSSPRPDREEGGDSIDGGNLKRDRDSMSLDTPDYADDLQGQWWAGIGWKEKL